MKKTFSLETVLSFVCLLGGMACATVAETDHVDAIDPLIGAVTYPPQGGWKGVQVNGHGFGKTFPGAATPFGMVQLSPDTVTGGDNGPGYSYTHATIEGFSHLHMSGIGWYGEFGNVQVMPVTGPREFDREKAASPYDHARETAKAGYYRVRLDRYGILAEATCARTAGVLRFTFPAEEEARVQIDLGRRIGQKERWLAHGRQSVRVLDDRSVAGRIVCTLADGGWGRGGGGVAYTVYFHSVFSRPFVRSGAWEGGTNGFRTIAFSGASAAHEGVNAGFWAEFGRLTAPLEMKTGISFTSEEDARANLARDVGQDGFDAVRQRARAAWRTALSGIAVEGGTARDRTVFATALYHAFLDPREIGRVTEGPYPYVRRTVFSGWDVYRSAFPLLTLLRPDVVSDTVSSMMATVIDGRRKTLPRWDIFGCPSGCMIGQPIVSVMADAWEKGIRTFDGRKALELASASLDAEVDRRVAFVPDNLSCTLEYAYADWCCGRLAEMLGERELAARHYDYAQAWTNCWSEEVGWMRSRRRDGSWVPWKGRAAEGQGCCETNPWQQGWFVPHDVEGLVRRMGGRARFTAELETFFGAATKDFSWCSAYNHPNEPCHTLPFLFAHSEKPELTGRWTRAICAKAYGEGPYGLCGNEDVGQMSAWYVLAAVGMHPLCPGDGRWYLTVPVFSRTVIRLDPAYYPGGAFTIEREGDGDLFAGATLNGRPLDRTWVSTREVSAGGVLRIRARK